MTELARRRTAKRREMDMTQGNIAGNLIRFALPLLAGNLFQQLYNMVDTWVIGQTGENGAYAAVGSVGPIINILIGFFMGLSSGAGVVISQYYGAKREGRVQIAVHTSLAMTLILGVVFTVLGVTMTPWMLRMMLRTKEETGEIFGFAREYLTIYFSGVLGLMIYNMGSGILRAVGDSRRPFYYLVVSAVTNTVLDLVFVFWMDMGVAGVAYATILAQWLSALLTVITLLRTDSCIKLVWRELKINFYMLKKIIKVGIPAALQLAITSFSNVFVQSYIANVNADQAFCLGGWTTYTKMDQFIFLPIQSLALSATTFVGQNLGISDMDRARRGALIAYGMATAVTACMIALVWFFAPTLAGWFNDDPGVMYYAKLLLRYLTPFYLLCCINQVFAAALRGAGNSGAPMAIMLGSFVGFRQVYLYVVSNYLSNEILPVAFSYPAGWLMCSIAMLLYYRQFSFYDCRLVEEVDVVENIDH